MRGKSSSKKEELERKILEHELVPKHIVLSPEEAKKVLDKLNVIPQQLPKILEDDPIVRIIGARPGDIIMIVRRSPTAGVSIAYRYVVSTEGEKK